MQAGVFRLVMAHPRGVSALERLIRDSRLRARDIVAASGKPEGKGCGNARTRGCSAEGSMALLGRHLGEPADTLVKRIPRLVSGGAEHQGPDGGGLIAVIAERTKTSGSTSCAS